MTEADYLETLTELNNLKRQLDNEYIQQNRGKKAPVIDIQSLPRS